MHDKVINSVKNFKYDGYQRGLASMVYKRFDKIPLWLQLKIILVEQLQKCLTKH